LKLLGERGFDCGGAEQRQHESEHRQRNERAFGQYGCEQCDQGEVAEHQADGELANLRELVAGHDRLPFLDVGGDLSSTSPHLMSHI
jgi:hypothetical protein